MLHSKIKFLLLCAFAPITTCTNTRMFYILPFNNKYVDYYNLIKLSSLRSHLDKVLLNTMHLFRKVQWEPVFLSTEKDSMVFHALLSLRMLHCELMTVTSVMTTQRDALNIAKHPSRNCEAGKTAFKKLKSSLSLWTLCSNVKAKEQAKLSHSRPREPHFHNLCCPEH